MKTKYKNISDQELVIVGIGVVAAGQEFISSQEIINPNIQKLEANAPEKAIDSDTKQEAKS